MWYNCSKFEMSGFIVKLHAAKDAYRADSDQTALRAV